MRPGQVVLQDVGRVGGQAPGADPCSVRPEAQRAGVQAAATGCLVVGSDTAPVREGLEDGMNGRLVGAFDRDAIVARMLEGLAMPAEAASVVRNAAMSAGHYSLPNPGGHSDVQPDLPRRRGAAGGGAGSGLRRELISQAHAERAQ